MADDLHQVRLKQSEVQALSWKECILLFEGLITFILRSNDTFIIIIVMDVSDEDDVIIQIKERLPLSNSNPHRKEDELDYLQKANTLVYTLKDTSYAYLQNCLYDIVDTHRRWTIKDRSQLRYEYSDDVDIPSPDGWVLIREFPLIYTFNDGSSYQLMDSIRWAQDDNILRMFLLVRKGSVVRRKPSAGQAPNILKELEAVLPANEATQRHLNALWKEYKRAQERDDPGR